MEIEATLIAHLRTVMQILQAHHITHALAGGLAYSALIETRATIAIDVLILLQDTSMQTVFQLLAPSFETFWPHPQPMQFPRQTIWRAVGLTNQREYIVDFLLAESAFHHAILGRAMTVTFSGLPLRVVTLEDLVLLKWCARRPQDMVDVQTITLLFQNTLDQQYLAAWIVPLNLPPIPYSCAVEEQGR
jgi:hypothetical protein